jgi:probable HAF family extracellular repeat protein
VTTQQQKTLDFPTGAAAMTLTNGHRSPLARRVIDAGYNIWTRNVAIRAGLILLAIFIGVYFGATLARGSATGQYHIFRLPTLGGTNSGGNSINNRGWVAGYSRVAGDQRREAALWRDGELIPLGTLGGPNSSVAWPVNNNRGIIVGISQTDEPEPEGERWSCSAFFSGPFVVGKKCFGFVWDDRDRVMKKLPPLGGNNSFATAANNRRQVVGWAETSIRDPQGCEAPQVFQFVAVIWNLKKDKDDDDDDIEIEQLPPLPGDTTSAAVAINNRGQVVGISGRCDQAVGRHSARVAALWDKGEVIEIGNLGAPHWATATAINEQGDVAGFASQPDAGPDEQRFSAFLWTKRGGIQDLPELPGDNDSQAYGINERGEVVGLSCNATGCRAVIWRHGKVEDLNNFKGSYTGHLETAKDINDLGEITGRAIINPSTGEREAYLAIPTHR